MPDRIHELLNRNPRRSSVKATPPAVVRQSRSSTPMTASSMCLPAFSSGTAHWTSSQETCVRLTLTSCTRLTASRRRSIMPDAWRGGPVRVGKVPITQVWT